MQILIKEVFSLRQTSVLYYIFGGSLVTLELISLTPLVGSPKENPLAVKAPRQPTIHAKLFFLSEFNNNNLRAKY